jgi:GT2 family glycosyltransferase
VSVIICSHNRCGELTRALDAVLNQRDAPPHEVILVDNGSTDDTCSMVLERVVRHPHLRYVFEPRIGLPYARNAGIEASTAPLIAFTDDDVLVAEDWVSRVKAAFDRYPDADCIGGPVLPRWPEHGKPRWLTPKQLTPLALQEKGSASIVVDRSNAAPCLIGANFAFRRSAFERAGVFSPEFVRSQDRELQLRLWRAGGKGVYVPDAVTTVDVPAERLTKEYFRFWYSRAGRYHSRMALLEVIDARGALVELLARDHRLFGVSPFVYAKLIRAVLRWTAALVTLRRTEVFYQENRIHYLRSYIRERWRTEGPSGFRQAVREVAAFGRTRLTARRTPPPAKFRIPA